MPAARLAHEEEIRLVERYQSGTSLQDLAEEYHLSITTARRICWRHGIETPRRVGYAFHGPQRRLTPAQREEAVTRYQAGESIPALAKHFGVQGCSIHGLLRRRGIQCRPSSVANRHCLLNEGAFEVPGEERDYWVGFLMADGCVHRAKRSGSWTVNLVLQASDRAHVERFRTFLGSNHSILDRPPSGRCPYQAAGLSVTSARLCESLQRFGVTERKSLQARAIGLESSPHFWRGVIDGDGAVIWTRTQRSRWRNPQGEKATPNLILVGSRPLLEQFQAYVRVMYPVSKASVRSHSSIWTFGLTGNAAIAVIRSLYATATVALERKLTVARDIISRCQELPPIGIFLDYGGERLCLGEWARRLGVSRACLSYRLETGWSIEEALTTPSRRAPCKLA